MKKVISIKKAAELLGVHACTVYRWYKAGNFVPRVNMGPRRFGFFEADVAVWAEGRLDRAA